MMKYWEEHNLVRLHIDIVKGEFCLEITSGDYRNSIEIRSSSLIHTNFSFFPDDFGGTEVCDITLKSFDSNFSSVLESNGYNINLNGEIKKGSCLTIDGPFYGEVLVDSLEINETNRRKVLP